MGIAERKQREFERREEDILNAAFELFAEMGLNQVTVDMIAKAAEIGKGTIYKHFKSKYEIFALLSAKNGEETIQRFAKGIDTSASTLDQLKQFIRIIWDKFIEDPKAYRVIKHCDVISENAAIMEEMRPAIKKRFKETHDGIHDKALQLIQKTIDEGIIIDEPAENIFLIGYGLISGTIDYMGLKEMEPTEDIYKLVERTIIKGMLKD